MSCSTLGCDGPVVARGWCEAHYRRWRRRGTTDAAPKRTRSTRDYWAERRDRNRKLIDAAKGEVCSGCGGSFSSSELHFHHRDPATKVFAVANGLRRSEKSLLAEIAKCDVLCPDCHVAADRELNARGRRDAPRDAHGRYKAAR